MILKLSKEITTFLIMITIVSCNNNSSNNNHEYDNAEYEYIQVKKDCSECDGSGEVNIPCSECEGNGYTNVYILGTRPKTCTSCHGSGIASCRICKGTNICQTCGGRAFFRCSVCGGYGIIVIDRNNPDSWIKCNHCDGSGYEDCLSCSGAGKCLNCKNGMADCKTCWGTGFYDHEDYIEIEEEECSYCNGKGYYYERCDKCDGSGTIVVEKRM